MKNRQIDLDKLVNNIKQSNKSKDEIAEDELIKFV